MRVYIVGAIAEQDSYDYYKDKPAYTSDLEYTRVMDEFKGACAAIGGALVRDEHTVIVDISNWERLRKQVIVAPHVIEGIKREKATSKPFEIVLYQPRDNEPVDTTPGIADTIAELKAPLPSNPSNINWTQNIYVSDADFFTNMRDADAFILLGGGTGTGLTGQTAAYLGKPVVALRSFGGAAADSFDLVLSTFYRDLGLQTSDIVALTKSWDAKPETNRADAEAVVRFMLDLQLALRRRRIPGDRALLGLLLLMPLALIAWVLTFIGLPVTPLAAVSYILLLVISSILGTGLRLLSTAQSRNSPVFTLQFMWKEITLSFLVAFGLMLIYVIGGFSFTGDMVVLVDSDNTAIATGLSVVGFAAGFVLPIARLRSQLSDAISNSPNGSKP